MKKISRWDAELALKLAARAIGKNYSQQYVITLLHDVSKYIKDSNLPTVIDYYLEAKGELK